MPVVLRVFDRQLGHRLESSFGFRHVWSTSAIAAPWFVGGALGLDVLFTFYVGNHPFLLARLRVSAGGGLDGLAMRELPGTVRVVAIRRAAGSRRPPKQPEAPTALEHPPRRDTRLAPDDDAYLVGPYAELLEILRHDRERRHDRRAGLSRRPERARRVAAARTGGRLAGARAACDRGARARIISTSRSIVGQARPWRRPARSTEPGIASISGVAPGGDVALHRAAERVVRALELVDRLLRIDVARRPRPARPRWPPRSRPTSSARSAGCERISPSSLS